MPHIRIHGNEQWYNPCTTPLWIYKYGSWRRIEHGTRFYYNGVWRIIDCGLAVTGAWVENTSECEQEPYSGAWVENTTECQTETYTGEWVENTSECQQQ